MIQNVVQARLVVKNGPSSEWEAKNPVLLSGELGYAKDTNVLKIGDGITPWNALSSISGGLTALVPGTATTVGGVLSSNKPNEISIDETGVMSLNQVSTSLLYVPEEEELILDGGKA